MLARPLTFLSALLAVACGHGGPKPRVVGDVFVRGGAQFRFVPLSDRWTRLAAPHADLEWADREADAVIGAKATCHGHGDPPLGTLVNDLLIGTTQRRYLLEETVQLDGRAAQHDVVQLEVDGVPLVYDLYVLKKNGCVYDLTLIARPQSYEDVADEFVGFVAGFHALAESEPNGAITTARRGGRR